MVKRILSGNWSKRGHAVREFVRNMTITFNYISNIAKHIELEFDLPIFLKSHVELLFHLPRYALLILTSISIFY